jgi:hypothetical protein
MRIALAGWLAGAAAAAARDVPVYREYTVPISFADEAGSAFAADAAAAPDRVARRELRDGPSREVLLGRETILDLGQGFVAAGGASAPVPGKLTPPAADDRRRGAKPDSERNWLASSLALPTLGQTTSNAAAAAIARDPSDSSGRGWLVDEVAKAATGPETPQDQWMQELEGNEPFGREPVARPETTEEANPVASRAAPWGESAARRSTPGRNPLPGSESGRAAAAWPASAAGAAADGGLSQTRQLIAEYSGNARPDFAALRASLVQASPSASVGDNSLATGRFGPAPASGSGRSAFSGTPAASGSSWKGGWNAAGTGLAAPPRIEPLPAPVVPAAEASRTTPSGGGYKPGWH